MESFTHLQPTSHVLPRNQRLLTIAMLVSASWAVLIMAEQLVL